MFLFSLFFYPGWMRREKMAVFLHTSTFTNDDHRHISRGLGHTRRPFKKNRLHETIKEKEKEKEEDDGDEEMEPINIRIAAFDIDFLRYVYNSL